MAPLSHLPVINFAVGRTCLVGSSWEVIMDGFRPSIEVAPLQSEGSLYGFMLIGRWPHDTVEWAKFLVLAVQMAAVPGLLPASTVFRVREELPEQPQPGAVGLVVAEGQLMGDHPLRPGQFAAYRPPGLIVLHPPSSTLPSVPDYDVASGCVFLPGLPHLGLDHRAAWVEADVEGTVTHLVSKVGIDPWATPTPPPWPCCWPPDVPTCQTLRCSSTPGA